MSVIPDKVWAMSESSRSEGATNLNLAFAELLEEIRRLELKACPDVDIRDHDAFHERLFGADRTRQTDSTLTQHMTTAARAMALEILERKSNSPAALAALAGLTQNIIPVRPPTIHPLPSPKERILPCRPAGEDSVSGGAACERSWINSL